MSSSEILQEYLVRIGYQTDAVSLKKFEDGLGTVGKRVLNVGTAVAGVMASVEAASIAFAYSMRRAYFESQLSNTTVKNMKAMEFAGTQIGISADTMANSVIGLNMAMTNNPGLKAYASSLTGINEEGREAGDVLRDLIKATKQMPEYQGSQIMSLFGMDQQTYHMWRNNIDEFEKKMKDMKVLYKGLGVDQDEAARAGKEYAESVDHLKLMMSALGDQMLITSSGITSWATKAVEHVAEGWIGILQGKINVLKDLQRVLGISQKDTTGQRTSSGKIHPMYSPVTAEQRRVHAEIMGGGTGTTPSSGNLLSDLEAQYQLPANSLAALRKTESNGNDHAVSPAGAMGPFQFMPATAKEYGLSNPFDLKQAARAAAKKYAGLLKHYKNNQTLALQAYNWGEGNLDAYLKTGKGIHGQNMPAETSAYAQKVLGQQAKLGGSSGSTVSMTQNNTFNVTGTGAKEIATAVGKKQDRLYSDTIREMKGSIS